MRSFKIAFVLTAVLSLSVPQAFAAASEIFVSGIVMAFDGEHVTLKQDSDSIVIPRSYLGGKKPKSGETLTVGMSPKQVMDLKVFKNKK
jgi:hypothetical protein